MKLAQNVKNKNILFRYTSNKQQHSEDVSPLLNRARIPLTNSAEQAEALNTLSNNYNVCMLSTLFSS